ncbi:uncharacterized protein LOC126664673 isoform X2 [Mercurialis annua]|uniref:uncharacterized protein LOC126664673 isoform X2 n=1 Tax=Mercurialis annua TaxID=3986 RepID=UPI00215F99B6|nr:uncharacterized protein LOC126664673 isoform X2 [Mercurialis annua]
MKPSLVVSIIFFSILLLLLHQVKGIRFEKGFMQVDHQKEDVEEKNSLIKRNSGVISGEVTICKDGHCSTGINRKLTTLTASSSTSTSTDSSKNGENGRNIKAKPKSKGIHEEEEKLKINSASNGEQQKVSDHDGSFVDIMDYSPARRKPPIHN